MELSRERKIFIGIFGTAIAALGIDRGLFGPSEAAAASPSGMAQITLADPVEEGASVQTGGVGRTISIFAERLQTLGGDGAVDPMTSGDAFSVPASWLEVEASEQETSTPKTPPGPPTLRVTSVMPTKSGGIAIVEGRTYRQGEAIGDFVLETVEARSIILRRGDRLYRVELSVRP